ncbi:lysophospholipid acyltransferase family protein [Marinoscillum furvescens]|uniref:1-acyl-sn-glycerol-3-phosphate acyltransferase n=1 Tax=Marinoscillum furvescens DSM 4134 TaxID=1122208 RepID=A0A3D9L4R0_MARFU|nr:lysophospholipid acyltransferase family protein [Marinoscillum furvescens]REE00572.1 1-acyl-sn-glycerol-3-phosphate acyltransferase [Marinoscillum furvescens DSM 4134]
MKEHWFYYFTKYGSWLGLKFFFGGVKLIGKEKIPDDGALLFTPNHQGAFMDAMLVGAYAKKPVSFLTRSDVFNKWSTPILNALNMMPIYRIRDGIKSLSQNDQVFETCFKMLSEGKSILIFPEGNHGIEYYLRPLSKGTARLALDARDRIDPKTKVYIIPTGINYFSHYRPLAKVLIKYGDPIELQDYMELYREHKQKGYNKLRQDLAEAMKSTLILPEDGEDYEQKRDWIFQPRHEHLSFEELKAMGEGTPGEPRKPRKKGILAKVLIGFMSIFNLPPILGVSKVIKGIKDKVFYVSIKYLLGSLLHILWWSLIFALGVIFIGWKAGLLLAGTAILTAYARQSLIKF